MRGCTGVVPERAGPRGEFPAHAGMYRLMPISDLPVPGVPRACGDVPSTLLARAKRYESSPRMRGCTVAGRFEHRLAAEFPAHAGMYRRRVHGEGGGHGVPRACGDVPSWAMVMVRSPSSSPRMRGCTGRIQLPGRWWGEFPAHAGMYRRTRPCRTRVSRVPRACGDVPHHGQIVKDLCESSPRMRGCTERRIG